MPSHLDTTVDHDSLAQPTTKDLDMNNGSVGATKSDSRRASELTRPVKGSLQLDDLVQVARRLAALKPQEDDDASSAASSIAVSSGDSGVLSPHDESAFDSDLSSLNYTSSRVASTSWSSHATESIGVGTSSDDDLSSSAISTIASSISSPSESSCDEDSNNAHAASRNYAPSSVLAVFAPDPRLPRRRPRRSLSSFGIHTVSSSSDSGDSSDDSAARFRRNCIPFHRLVQAKDHQRHAAIQDAPPSQTQHGTLQPPLGSCLSPSRSSLDADDLLQPSAALVEAATRPPNPHLPTRFLPYPDAANLSKRSIPPPRFCIPGMTAAKSSSSSDWYMSYATSQLPTLMDAYVPKHAKIVDVGCGYSALCHELVLTGYSNVTGIDIDANAIAAQRDRGALLESFLHFQEVDARKLHRTFGAQSVDCLVVKATLDIVGASDRLDILDSCLATLRPGGVLLWVSCQAEGAASCWWQQPQVHALLSTSTDTLRSQTLGPVVGPATGHVPGFVAKACRVKESPAQLLARTVSEETHLVEQTLGWQCIAYRQQLSAMDDEFNTLIAREGPPMLMEDWVAHARRQVHYDEQNVALIDAYTVEAEEEMRVAECSDMAAVDAEAAEMHITWTVVDAMQGVVSILEAAHEAAQAALVQERTELIMSQVWQVVDLAVAVSDAARAEAHALQSFVADLLSQVVDSVVGNLAAESPTTPLSDEGEDHDVIGDLPQLSSQDADVTMNARPNEAVVLKETPSSQESATMTSPSTDADSSDDYRQVQAVVAALVAQVVAPQVMPAEEPAANSKEDARSEVLAVLESLIQATER